MEKDKLKQLFGQENLGLSAVVMVFGQRHRIFNPGIIRLIADIATLRIKREPVQARFLRLAYIAIEAMRREGESKKRYAVPKVSRCAACLAKNSQVAFDLEKVRGVDEDLALLIKVAKNCVEAANEIFNIEECTEIDTTYILDLMDAVFNAFGIQVCGFEELN